MLTKKLIVFIIFVFGLNFYLLAAQNTTKLEFYINNINEKLAQIETISTNIKEEKSYLNKTYLKEELNKIQNQLAENLDTLIELASGEKITKTLEEQKINKPLYQELEELIRPFLKILQDVSKKPKKIQELTEQIEFLNTKIKAYDKTNKILDNISIQDRQKIKLIKLIESTKQELINQKNILENELDNLKGSKKTIYKVLKENFIYFINNKGKNLLIAFIISILAILFVNFIITKILNKNILSMQNQKILIVIKCALATTLSILIFISTLYLIGDWFLFSLSILILFLLLWSIKTSIPRFIEEIKLILNLGKAKEGEVIIYNNIPFLISKISYKVILKNKELDGGNIELKLKDILDLNSRPLTKEEKLFPTQKGDLILINGTLAKVVSQNLNYVELKIADKETLIIKTSEFISKEFKNLKDGFFIKLNLNLDYKHIKEITIIEENFKKELNLALNTDEFLKDFKNNITIDFELAELSASSIDFALFISASKELAPYYYKLQRKFLKILTNIANKYNYTIPFNQLTVHLEK